MTDSKKLESKKSPEPLSLSSSWTFWYLIRHSRGSVQPSNYAHSLTSLGTFQTAEDFWALYSHLRRAPSLPDNTDYQVFREGVRPAWEDPANEKGGKWALRLRKGLISRLWEHLLLALMAGILDGLGICGVVMSIRHAEDIISIWNEDATDEDAKIKLRDEIKRALCLPPNIPMEYKAHDSSIKDCANRSSKNTQ